MSGPITARGPGPIILTARFQKNKSEIFAPAGPGFLADHCDMGLDNSQGE